LDLGLDRFVLGSGLERVGVHAQQSEECLAAAIGQENAKGESSKYGTGETYKIHRVHGGIPICLLSTNL
jgi:hypothetical protein